MLIYTTLALAILVHTFIEASYALGHRRKPNAVGKTNPVLQENGREALAFIQGTSLEIMIEQLQLGYDPQEIRFQFYARFNKSC